MSNRLVLRDPFQPCEHYPAYEIDEGYAVVGAIVYDPRFPYWECSKDDCPGGREVVIDYDRAQELLDAAIDSLHGPGLVIDVRPIIDAALGEEVTNDE